MLMEFGRTVAYFCPMCSGITLRELHIFDFSGSRPAVLSCDHPGCGEAPVRIAEKKGRYQLEIQCPVCDEIHGYTLRPATFWGKRFFSLRCPNSGINIFFLGDREEISLNLDKSTPLTAGIIEDMDVEDELNLMFDIVECINDLSKEKSIYCACGSRNITISADDKKVVLRCAQCGRTKEIPATLESLVVLMNSTAVILQDTKR